MDAMDFLLRQTRLGLLNSATRLPFRYGIACLTRCPQAILEATIEVGGRLQTGYSGDGLPPSWFDKTPIGPIGSRSPTCWRRSPGASTRS